MKAIYRMVVVGAALGLAGCSSLPGANIGDTLVMESFLGKEIPGGTYTNELARAYQARAAYEASFGIDGDTNWYDATAFYRKARAAEAGEEVMPWDPAAFGLNSELSVGYQETLSAVAQYKDVRPTECAEMVALYDHWLEQTAEGDHSVTPAGAVQGLWSDARFKCIGGVTPPTVDGRFTVYFGFNRSDLDATARGVVDEVVAYVSGVTANAISIVGHTDTVGSKSYNQALSERRARSVQSALVGDGVPGGIMTVAGRSELELAVPTADGVREPLNRRVVIEIAE